MAELADLIDEFKKAPPAGKALAVVSVIAVAGLGLYVAHVKKVSGGTTTSTGAGVLPVDVSSALGGSPSSGVPFPNFPADNAASSPAQVGTPPPTETQTLEQGTFGSLGPNVLTRITSWVTVNGKQVGASGQYKNPNGQWVNIPLQSGQYIVQGSSNRVWIQDTKAGTQSLLTSGTGAPIDITNNSLSNFQSHPIAGAISVSSAPIAQS
jgi:hypothetical protein